MRLNVDMSDTECDCLLKTVGTYGCNCLSDCFFLLDKKDRTGAAAFLDNRESATVGHESNTPGVSN